MGVRGTIVLAIVALWAASAWALDERGAQFDVNAYTSGNQINPAVSGLNDGDQRKPQVRGIGGGGFVVSGSERRRTDKAMGCSHSATRMPARRPARSFV